MAAQPNEKASRRRGPSTFEVFNTPSFPTSHGVFDTLDEARGCVAFDHLVQYEIWQGDTIVEASDPDAPCNDAGTDADDRHATSTALADARRSLYAAVRRSTNDLSGPAWRLYWSIASQISELDGMLTATAVTGVAP